MIMAAKDRALRINSIKRIIDKEICLQSVECVEKAMRQLAILYRNAGNLLKSNLYRFWRHDKVGLMIHSFGTYVESWVMAGMKEA